MNPNSEIHKLFHEQNRHFDDLSPYTTEEGHPFPRILRIGWLQANTEYPQGELHPSTISKIDAIKNSKWPMKYHFNLSRGPTYCELCPENDRAGFNTELLIPNVENPGHYFGCPSIIDHLVIDHNYKPPEQFVNSIIEIDLSKHFYAATAFDEAHMSLEAMRTAYEIHAKHHIREPITSEGGRYRYWLEAHNFWPIRE